MFDGEAFGQQMVEIVRGFVSAEMELLRAENEALVKRLGDLERACSAFPEKGDKGDPGKDGPSGRDGRDGKDGVNGKDGRDGKDGLPGIEGKAGPAGRDGADGKDGRDGKDGTGIDDIQVIQDGATLTMAFQIGDCRSEFEMELPAGPAGKDGAAGKDGEPGPRGERGPDGFLSEVRIWEPGVHYAGELRTHGGGTWQAIRDTASAPPHEDWMCIAAPGAEGKSFNPRRLYDPAENYGCLDVIALNGGSFVAVKDDPGPCPGPGWMLLTQQGKRGERGEKGDKGERGQPGPALVDASIDEQGLLTLTNADGSIVTCDLYPLLSAIEGR